MEQSWPIKLFNKSVLKQRKLAEVARLLGPVDNLRCLDIGGDNGVVSYLLRQRGGRWASADLDERSVRAITQLVHTDVHQIDEGRTPFQDNEFDRIAVVDFLEHIPGDAAFMQELFRIMRPGGTVVLNVPHAKNSLLRKLRLALGQTDEKHGHVRPGYTVESLQHVLGNCFAIETTHTYSKFFSEFIDTSMVYAVTLLKRDKDTEASKKGLFVTDQDLSANKSMFRLYSLIYPAVWLFSRLDGLLFFSSGYMLIARARVNK
jgi:2-polyprenyl-3-methyl-5-hydroxy-6-metoxy-1,4-benzoquinol methylase